MPILVLLLVSLASGLLLAFAFDRLAPAEGATAATADALEHMAEHTAWRAWVQRRTDPSTATGLALTAAVGVMIAGGVVIAALTYLIRGNETLRSIDSSAAQWGHDHASYWSTRAIYWVTNLADWPTVSLLGIAILLYEWRRAPSRYLLPFILVVVLGDKLITTAIKQLVDRARPELNPIAETLGPSFPSGHSSTAAAFYAGLALIVTRRRSARVRALLAGAAGGIAVAVASSRVLLDVHWLSDVIAGVFLGWAWFCLCAVAFGGRRLHFADPMERSHEPPGQAARPVPRPRPPAEV